ncbi:helix-turn-helix domain-containing protein [Aquirhabdus sp.]|uniref:helix-turn-helix domain-containing protein n=1 Tax=Aquirhabdus sp. TaxID=2824160 RepID=UPI00396CFCF2
MFPIQYLEVCDGIISAKNGNLKSLYRRCSVNTQDLLDVTAMINGEQLLMAFTIALEYCSPNQPIVLQVLKHFPLTAVGMLGMLVLTSRTLGYALNAALEFFPLVMPAFTVTQHCIGDEVHLLFERLTDFGVLNATATELVMLVMHKIAVFMQVQFPSIHMHFDHPAARHDAVAVYEAELPIHIHFDSRQNIIIFPRASLDTPLSTRSLALHRMIEKTLHERKQRVEYLTPISHKVKRLIKLCLDENRVINGSVIAMGLNLSRRTLARRLAEEGYQLPYLYNEVCVEYAEDLLRHSQKSIAEIAYKAGFSNASNFTRTFKRITGKTPSSLRTDIK